MKGSLHVISIRGIAQGTNVSNKFTEMTWRMFKEGQVINHSQLGATLPAIMNRCEKEGIYYELRAFPGMGYTMKRIRNEPGLPDNQ